MSRCFVWSNGSIPSIGHKQAQKSEQQESELITFIQNSQNTLPHISNLTSPIVNALRNALIQHPILITHLTFAHTVEPDVSLVICQIIETNSDAIKYIQNTAFTIAISHAIIREIQKDFRVISKLNFMSLELGIAIVKMMKENQGIIRLLEAKHMTKTVGEGLARMIENDENVIGILGKVHMTQEVCLAIVEAIKKDARVIEMVEYMIPFVGNEVGDMLKNGGVDVRGSVLRCLLEHHMTKEILMGICGMIKKDPTTISLLKPHHLVGIVGAKVGEMMEKNRKDMKLFNICDMNKMVSRCDILRQPIKRKKN